MNFEMEEAIELLERAPQTLEALLSGLSEGWRNAREGDGTWSPVEVAEHLLEAERTNWIPRLAFILREGKLRPFPSFDRYAHLQGRAERPLEQVLAEFKTMRSDCITRLRELVRSERDLEVTGIHPALGEVKVRELLSAWVVHDLTHLSQILRVMAKRYRADVGPFIEFLSILK